MNKLKIGFDLDGVIADTTPRLFDFYYKKTGIFLNSSSSMDYDLDSVFNLSKEGVLKLYDEFYQSDFFDEIGLVKNADFVLSLLSNGEKIPVITARPECYKEKTEKLFKRHLGHVPLEVVYQGGFHNENGRGKGEICKELGIKIFVEDKKENAIECSQRGVRVLLFNRPYNQNFEHENIIRVYNWQNILKEVERLRRNGG